MISNSSWERLCDVSDSMHGVKYSLGLYTGITTLTLSMRLTLS